MPELGFFFGGWRMSKEKLIYSTALHSETMSLPSHSVSKREVESWVFDELPHATVVSVSRPDTSDISAILFSYTIEFHYKQARCFLFIWFLIYRILFQVWYVCAVDLYWDYLSFWVTGFLYGWGLSVDWSWFVYVYIYLFYLNHDVTFPFLGS